MNSRIFVFLFLILINFKSWSQTHNQEKYQLKAFKTTFPLKADGKLDEEVWQRAEAVSDFWQKFPTADVKAKTKTVVQAAYDDRFLYFAIKTFDSTGKYIAPTLKRDFTIRESDGVAVILDPLNRKSNGFAFSSTPYNVQTEYLIGGSSDGPGATNTAWDNKWFSEVTKTADGYTIEMAIPFKTLRYDVNVKTWGVNFITSDQKNFKFNTWTNVPVQFPGFDLGYLGTLTFEGEIPDTKKNYAFIPFITGGVNSIQSDTKPTDVNPSFGAGFDAKLSLTPSINMDFTLLPDFSQVDVDQQVTNLTRFSIFFPERRTFFLENDDIFSDYGSPPMKPFFSRRIGLDKNNQPIPILFGAKVSGSINEKTRIGAFNMQTSRKGDYDPQNFTALSIIRRVGKRSTIKSYMHNVSTDLSADEEKRNPLQKYGRNIGAEYALSDAAGKYQAWGGLHLSQKQGITDKNTFSQIGFGYFGSNLSFFTDFGDVKTNYYTDMGFVNRIETFTLKGLSYESGDTTIRNGFKQSYSELTFTKRPKNKMVVSHNFTFSNYTNWFENNDFSDANQSLMYLANLKNSSSFSAGLDYNSENLRYAFPLPSEKPLEPGNYKYANANFEYRSDSRKNFLWQAKALTGQYYNGFLQQYSATVSVRKQPYWTLSLLSQYNIIDFPDQYGDTKILLFSPKTEVSFSNKLFWTTFYQFNTQANNFNINSRVQYRYSPMSDLFIVYTDNYFTDPLFKNKNRGLVFKLNYWIS